MAVKLDPMPARNLTSRECARILGSTIGGLFDMADKDALRTAVVWWAEHFDEATAMFQKAISNLKGGA